jgi:hypothetical protein
VISWYLLDPPPFFALVSALLILKAAQLFIDSLQFRVDSFVTPSILSDFALVFI